MNRVESPQLHAAEVTSLPYRSAICHNEMYLLGKQFAVWPKRSSKSWLKALKEMCLPSNTVIAALVPLCACITA